MKAVRISVVGACAAVVCWHSATALVSVPQTAKDWVQLAQLHYSSRLAQVDNYVEKIAGGQVPGLAATGLQDGRCMGNCRVFTTVDIPLANGETLKAGHLLSPTEVAVLAGAAPNSTNLAMFGFGMAAAQDAFAANADQMLGDFAGIANNIFGATEDPDDSEGPRKISNLTTSRVAADAANRTYEENEADSPWLNPFRLFGAGAMMFGGAAIAVGEAEASLAESGNQALAEAARMQEALQNAELGGEESIDGEMAMRIDIPELDAGGGGKIPKSATSAVSAAFADGDATFVPKSASVWIRPGKYVIVKHRLDGIAMAEGETREFYIENTFSDFRDVPNSDMYEPYKRTMRMGGMLDEEQMAQMEEARKQLEEFDKQLAAMSPQERQMVENMMGSQMNAVRSMANGGVFEYVEIIDEIIVNADIKALFGSPMALDAQPSPPNLLQRIQVDLTTLGYTPGNTDGVMDTMTTVAISQYQAERGLTVTGEPSEQLASALAAELAQ